MEYECNECGESFFVKEGTQPQCPACSSIDVAIVSDVEDWDEDEEFEDEDEDFDP